MKRLIYIFVFIAFHLFAFVYESSGAPSGSDNGNQPKGEPAKSPLEEIAEGKGKGDGHGNSKQEENAHDPKKPLLLRLQPIKISVIKDKEVVAYVQISIDIEVLPTQDIEIIKSQGFIMHSAFVQDLHHALSTYWQGHKPGGEDPKPDDLKKRLLGVIEKKLGTGKINNLHIRQIFVQRIVNGKPVATPLIQPDAVIERKEEPTPSKGGH